MTKTKILIVEDESIVAQDIKTILQDLGYDVCPVVASGEEAVKIAEENMPSLVLMDIVLKGEMDGVEAAEQIHSRFNIPIVYLTAYADEEIMERAKITEPYGYILKPFEDRELQSNIEIALYKHDMESKLKESEEWLSTILKSIGDAVIAADTEGRINFMNPVAQSLTGWKQEEAEGKPLEDVFNIIDEETGEKAENPVTKVLREGIVIGLANHTVLIAKDGTRRFIDDSGAPIRDDSGNITGVVLTFRDITERKKAEEEKEKLQKQLLQAQKMESIGTLAGGVAHDFNNQLTVIGGNAQVAMMEVDESEPLYRSLKQINHAVTRSAKLIRQLLLFSRKETMEFETLSINQTIDELLKMLNRLIGEDIAIQTELQSDVYTIQGDAVNIEQVITNIVVNARDAMPEGGNITIKTQNVTLDKEDCKFVSDAKPGKYVRLSIKDTGEGMDEETIERIFEPFFSTKKAGKGTGLGLSVVYGIVKEHEGWINVYSEPGHGSTFKVYLPASSVKLEDKAEETISLQDLSGNGERILLVEDEEQVRMFTKKTLSSNGYIVFEVTCAQEALDIFEREKGEFDLLFSDTVLPDESGLQLVDQLLRREPELPVLLCSGYPDKKSHKTAIREREIPFIQKPFNVVDLLETISEVIG